MLCLEKTILITLSLYKQSIQNCYKIMYKYIIFSYFYQQRNKFIRLQAIH